MTANDKSPAEGHESTDTNRYTDAKEQMARSEVYRVKDDLGRALRSGDSAQLAETVEESIAYLNVVRELLNE